MPQTFADYYTLREEVRRLMDKKGLQQKDLAEMLGKTQGAISQMLNSSDAARHEKLIIQAIELLGECVIEERRYWRKKAK